MLCIFRCERRATVAQITISRNSIYQNNVSQNTAQFSLQCMGLHGTAPINTFLLRHVNGNSSCNEPRNIVAGQQRNGKKAFDQMSNVFLSIILTIGCGYIDFQMRLWHQGALLGKLQVGGLGIIAFSSATLGPTIASE